MNINIFILNYISRLEVSSLFVDFFFYFHISDKTALINIKDFNKEVFRVLLFLIKNFGAKILFRLTFYFFCRRISMKNV